MKKLILLAGVLAIGGAFGACKFIDKKPTPTSGDSAWAYKWKFTGKTTKAVKAVCHNKTGYISRSSASLKIQGWSFYCEPDCEDFEAGPDEADEIFWQSKPSKKILDGGTKFELANIIGKKGKNYEAAGTAAFSDADGITKYDLWFAGLGKFDQKKKRVKSISGNFAGRASAPWLDDKSGCSSDISQVWTCCGCPTENAWTVAYGKWSVKYNKSWAKKYANGKAKWEKLVPKWAR